MKDKRRKYIVKYHGKYQKALYVSRSKACVVFEIPGVFHSTFPVKDKAYHTTLKGANLDDETKKLLNGKSEGVVFEDDNFRQTLKKETSPDGSDAHVARLYLKHIATDLDKGISLGTWAGLGKEVEKLKQDYILVDLDSLKCETPNIFLSLFSSASYVEPEEKSFVIYSDTIKYDDVTISVQFIDVAKFAEHIKPKQ